MMNKIDAAVTLATILMIAATPAIAGGQINLRGTASGINEINMERGPVNVNLGGANQQFVMRVRTNYLHWQLMASAQGIPANVADELLDQFSITAKRANGAEGRPVSLKTIRQQRTPILLESAPTSQRGEEITVSIQRIGGAAGHGNSAHIPMNFEIIPQAQ
jgi:hypothetical protein